MVFIILLIFLFHQQHLYFVYRQALFEKFAPTLFPNSAFSSSATFFGDIKLQQHLLANRAAWEALGTGKEGTTYKFNGSVIKTFTPGLSPFRNCMQNHSNQRWPTEIPVSIEFGGSGPSNGTFSGFLPVNTYFMEESSSNPQWYLVTPLVGGGNTVNLARRLRSQHPYKHFREIDSAYRPAFDKLLRTLERLHSHGYCHDDIKPANIFVNDDTEWILGDLGNVREVNHQYHTSRIWHDNHQLHNCRANDVFRVLKLYLAFIRAASNDRDAFDRSFFEGQEPLSRLFWWTAADVPRITADELRIRSTVDGPTQLPHSYSNVEVFQPRPPNIFLATFWSRKRRLAYAVTQTLKTKNPDEYAKIWAFTWLFGIPVPSC
ncbi:hypothetical protein B0J11DRAFT_551059 [Dendryphion nanum]|uniref:Protein kinase domain-containing protein n=1 Tax=Dendryphion nanum TaxID=256645 RepID=A0A9P9DNK2_9PLEO|nr:hypothetical protein B0J11DRAFT_551059 [Dendryphion nanum]